MSIVGDFKDIRPRMQGELKAPPIKKVCMHCDNGCGWFYKVSDDTMNLCSICNWDGVKSKPISITMP